MSADSNRLHLVLASMVLSWTCVAHAHAQEREGWSVDFGFERADVTIDNDQQVWGSEHIQFLYRDLEKGGAFLGGSRLTRFGQTDAVFLAGGYRHLGKWTVFGQIGLSPNADFYYRQSIEAEVSRRTVGTLVVHLKYRYLNFRLAEVHIIAPAATYHFPKGELHGRVFFVKNQALDIDSQALLARGQWQLNRRFRLAGGVAVGERIFDITFLPSVPAEGWLVYGETLIHIHKNDGLGIVVGFAHEEPFFDRRNFGVYYRRWF